MFVVQIQFAFDPTDENENAGDAVLGVLAAMYHNGQISSNEYLLLESPQGFASFVSLPAEDALENQNHNHWVEEAIEKFVQIGGEAPTFTVIGQDAESDGPCQCAARSGLILFTTFLSLKSALRCSQCFGPVPFYRVPPTHEGEYWNLRHWEADFKACDTLQMGCAVLERAAMRQMSRLDSPLTQSGLEICRLISESTQQPVYYYLYRHNGRSLSSEQKRKCPNCGGEWLLESHWHKFDFKCDNCHLVSNIAYSVNN